MTRTEEEAIRIELESLDHTEKQHRTVCEFVGGAYDGLVCTEEYVEQNLCNGDHTMDWSAERAQDGCVPYAVLDNVPVVSGYTDMWDGGRIRYETWDVYDMLSR